MPGLTESQWASVPDAPSRSAGQITTTHARRVRSTNTAPGNKRGDANSARQPPQSDPRAPPVPATDPSVPSSKLNPSPAAPRSSGYKTKPRRGRAVFTEGVKPPISQKDENLVSEAVSHSTRNPPRKQSSKMAGAKRKAPLATSVSSEPPSKIIEPTNPLTHPVEVIPADLMGEETITVPDSPKTLSHSSVSETLPPSTPVLDQDHQSLKPPPTTTPNPTSIRPLTPASTSHLDWADDNEGLPDLDDWGFTPGKPEPRPGAQRRKSSGENVAGNPPPDEVAIPVISRDPLLLQAKVAELHASSAMAEQTATSAAENVRTAATVPPKGAKPEAQLAEKRRSRKSRDLKKMASNEANAVPASSPENASESQSGTRDVASQMSKLAVNITPRTAVAASASSNPVASLRSKPVQSSLPTKRTPSSDKPSNSTSSKASPQPPKSSPSLPSRPTPSSPSSSAPPPNISNSAFPPRRKPFSGDSSDYPRSNRRERPSSIHHAHSASRPVISPNALNQLTKSLSGGNRVHHPTVTAE